MGSLLQQSTTKTTKCLDVAREARSRESPGPAVLDSSSPWDVSTVSSARETTPRGWELVPPSTWPPSWSTWLLRSSSWLATLPVTTRRPGSSPVTSKRGRGGKKKKEEVV